MNEEELVVIILELVSEIIKAIRDIVFVVAILSFFYIALNCELLNIWLAWRLE